MEVRIQDMACKEFHNSIFDLQSYSAQLMTPSRCSIDRSDSNSLSDMKPVALGVVLLPSVELYPPSATVSGLAYDEKRDQNVDLVATGQDAAEQVTKETGQEIPSLEPAAMESTKSTPNSDQSEVKFILSITRKRRRKKIHNKNQTENNLHDFNLVTQTVHEAGQQNFEALEFKPNHNTTTPEYNSTSQFMGRVNQPISPACPQTGTVLETSPIRERDPPSIAMYTIKGDQTLARTSEPGGIQHDSITTTNIPKVILNALGKRKYNEENDDDHLIDPELRKLDRQTQGTQQYADHSSQPTILASSYNSASSMHRLQANTCLASPNPASISSRPESSLDRRASLLTHSNDQLRRPSLYGVPVWSSTGQGANTSTTNSNQTPYHGIRGKQQVELARHYTPCGHWFGCHTESTGSPSALNLQTDTAGCNTNESRSSSANINLLGCARNVRHGNPSKYVGNHQLHESPTLSHDNRACKTTYPGSAFSIKTSSIAQGGYTNPYESYITSVRMPSFGVNSEQTVPYRYIPQQQVLPRNVPTYSPVYPNLGGRPFPEPKLQYLLVDIAQTAQQVFPFQDVARKHNIPIQKVFDTFSAIIQLPLLRSAADSRRQGSLGKERLKAFSTSKKKIQEKHEGAQKVANKTKQVTPAKRGRPPKRAKLTEN